MRCFLVTMWARSVMRGAHAYSIITHDVTQADGEREKSETDNVNLLELSEATLLYNTLLRYKEDDIYTFTGNESIVDIFTCDDSSKRGGRCTYTYIMHCLWKRVHHAIAIFRLPLHCLSVVGWHHDHIFVWWTLIIPHRTHYVARLTFMTTRKRRS